jgi:hypothetical protein
MEYDFYKSSLCLCPFLYIHLFFAITVLPEKKHFICRSKEGLKLLPATAAPNIFCKGRKQEYKEVFRRWENDIKYSVD